MIERTTVLGQPALRLVAPDGAEATVLQHGAQLVGWIPAGDQERLYLSPLATAGDGQAIRGGVPVIFPRFAAAPTEVPTLPRHGFARDRAWRFAESTVRGGAAIAVLSLADDERTRALWPHPFSAELTVVVAGLELDIELAVTNTASGPDARPFDFTAALHTYLRVDDVRRARLGGLWGVRYADKVHGGEQRQEIDPFSFAGEIDRIYFDAAEPLTLATAMGRMAISAEGFPDVVVWNPGPDKARALADLPDDDWLGFLCVEAGAIGRPVVLAPGETWAARQSFVA